MCAIGEPSPKLAADLAHAVLDVELLGAVARPGEREPGQRARGLHAGELVLVEEIAIAALVAEEQPVAPGCFARHAFVQEGAERRDAGAGTDHDDGHGGIGRQTEVLRLLDEDVHRVSGAHALAEEGGRDAEPRAAIDRVAHRIDAQRHAVAINPGRARDGIEPRLQRIERLDEGFRIGTHAGKFFDRGEHVERGGVAVRILAGGERFRLLTPVAAGDIGEELKQHVGGGAERDAVDQHVAQRPAADREIGRGGERRDHGVGERRIVGREHAEGIANRIIDAGRRQIELNMPGLLLGGRLVEARARQKARRGRALARTSRRAGRCNRSSGRRRGLARRLGRRRGLADLLVQRLERAGGFFATGHAKIQSLLLLQEDGVRIVLTVVSALSAVLLSHRCHHPPAQRTAFGELHAIGERHGRVVPRRAVVVLAGRSGGRREIERARQQRRRLVQRQRSDAVFEREQPSEQAVEPHALLGAEGRALRNERRQRGARRKGHPTTSSSIRDRSASISCRRVKARKLSCGDARCAR